MSAPMGDPKNRRQGALNGARAALKVDHVVEDGTGKTFDLVATYVPSYSFRRTQRKIKIVLDSISDQDIELVRRAMILETQTVEIWAKIHSGRGSAGWIKKGFNYRGEEIPVDPGQIDELF